MKDKWVIGAQLSTTHSAPAALNPDRMQEVLARVRAVIKLDLLILGSREVPEIFRDFCGPTRPMDEVYLWYNVLSDIEGMEDSDLVVNWRGERSRGWGGWGEKGAEVSETFRFVCPNNPAPRRKTLRRLRELLERYPFAGVFLDKIRFPSPANGIDEMLTCFCDHCRRAAYAVDLDLNAIIKIFETAAINVDSPVSTSAGGRGGAWFEGLMAGNPLLARFHRFRMDSITGLVAEAYDQVGRLGRKVSLDLFSPGLAPLVGQDYVALSRYCAWAKPMTYRIAEGPAGLRLEIPALAEGVGQLFSVDEVRISDWASRRIPAFGRDTLKRTRETAVPLDLIRAEIVAAVDTMKPVPVYFGLELVRHPGVIDITPSLVDEMIGAGRDTDAAGLIISWDLMHAPMESIKALAAGTRD